jgi:hypothetical protein
MDSLFKSCTNIAASLCESHIFNSRSGLQEKHSSALKNWDFSCFSPKAADRKCCTAGKVNAEPHLAPDQGKSSPGLSPYKKHEGGKGKAVPGL